MQAEYEVIDGRVFCPQCKQLGHHSVIAYVSSNTHGRAIICLCRRCKRRHVVDIAHGAVHAHL